MVAQIVVAEIGFIHLSSERVTDAGSIPMETVVLLGRLVTDSGSGDRYNGELFFSDGTGCIVCEVSIAVYFVTLFVRWHCIYSSYCC